MAVPALAYPFDGSYPVTAPFGEVGTWWRLGHHLGMDFGLPEGTPVLAAAAGTVTLAGPNGTFGNAVWVRSWWGVIIYAHFSVVRVSVGQQVAVGQQLGLSGSTGNVTGPHLHFQIQPDSESADNGSDGAVDPSPYLGAAPPQQPPPSNSGGSGAAPPEPAPPTSGNDTGSVPAAPPSNGGGSGPAGADPDPYRPPLDRGAAPTDLSAWLRLHWKPLAVGALAFAMLSSTVQQDEW